MSDLKDIRIWRTELGLLPVPLFGNRAETSAYVLLNGSRGNFCLYLDDRIPGQESRSEAWSANVGHSVAIHGNDVYVQRWDELQSFSIRKLSAQAVRTDLDEFHRSLERESPPSELSIIAHAVRVFRRLRTALGPSFHGGDALQAFLFLLAAAIDRVDRQTVRLGLWHLEDDAQAIALTIDEATWTALLEEMLNGRELDRLATDLSLTLRHASGMLFQEAHYAAVFDDPGQMSFPGFAPAPVAVETDTSAIGLHFTPPAIVRTVVEEALIARGPLPDVLIAFDPACGSSEFLRETLRQLQLREYRGTVKLIGFDVSPAACAMSRFILAWESRGLEPGVEVQIHCCNALDDDNAWPQGVDLVLMNPPFQSWQDMSRDLRETVCRVLGEVSQHRPDLAAAFLWKSLECLGTAGVLGTILPAPFLDGVSFRGLRDQMAERLTTLLIARLGSHNLFHGALVDACFYIGSRVTQDNVPLALWASHRPSSNSAALRRLRRMRALGNSVIEPIDSDSEGFSFYPNPQLGKKGASWAPRPFRDWRLAQRMQELPRVGDLFSVRQGTLTGLNRAFLLTKAEWLRLEDEERPYFRPAVFHESLRGGKFFDEFYVFYPYGPYSIDTEKELAAAAPAFYRERLGSHKEDLQSRKGIDPDHWWLLTRPREWRPVKKIISAYFGDAGSFAWDPDGHVVVVQGYSWIPKRKRGLTRQSWLAYLAVANSPIFSSLLAAHSNHVSGGQWNLSKRFLEPVPLPDLEAAAVAPDIRAVLSDIGARIHADGLEALSESDRFRLTETAEAAYLPHQDGTRERRNLTTESPLPWGLPAGFRRASPIPTAS
jgi:adenine-specific DNA-methyltransferase